MYILLAIILFVMFIHQSRRISQLESLIKSRGPVNASVTSQPNQAPLQTAIPPVAPVPAPTAPNLQTPKTGEESSGKLLGSLGIAAVVIGVGFFIKYAFDNAWIGPAGRVMLGILIGAAGIALGQWLRKKYLGYSDLLMGGGLAILYLAIYASYGFYHLVDPMLAFLGMIVVTLVGVGFSMFNSTQTLAFVSFIGGFLAPFMIGQDQIVPWILFTYITIINAGILAILIHKKWPGLILIGLVATLMHFGFWYESSYDQTLLVPTLIFILIQFLIFTASSLVRIIVARQRANELDYFILGSTALSFALICYDMLMPEYRVQTAIGSAIVAGLYLVIALIAYHENPEDRSINIFLPGLSVSFLTAAVPIQFSGPWIAAWWLIEALILYIIASKSSSRGFQVMGVVVYMLGLLDVFWYIITYQAPPQGLTIFFNGPFVMLLMAIAVAYMIAFIYYRFGSTSPEIQKRGIAVFVVLANILTLYACTTQITEYYQLKSMLHTDYYKLNNAENTTISLFWALYAALLTTLGFMKRYASLRTMGLILFLITAFRVLIHVWSLGELYRIISFIAFGIIALTASFLYVKYKDRLRSAQ